MANLIITIISIALVAVAAIMGAYYGGTAFLQSQTKAYANTSISQGEQITDAWSVFAADHGGSYTLANLSILSTTSSSPSGNPYLTTVPIAPGQVALSVWTIANLSDISGGTSAGNGYNGIYYALTKDANGASVCNYVGQAVGSAATNNAVSTSTVLNNLQGATGRKFDCVFNDAAISTSTTAGDAAFIYYRAF